MSDKHPDATPPGEHTSEASGEQKAKARPELSDPEAISGIPAVARGVPGRATAPEAPKNRAGDIPQIGMPQDENPTSASGLSASWIATIAYTAVQAYKEGIAQEPVMWGDLEPGDRKEIVGQVVASMIGQATSPARNHALWCENMRSQGKTRYNDERIGMLWNELPAEERRKAYLFEAVVRALLTTLP